MQIDVGYFYFIKDSFFDVIIEKLFRCKIIRINYKTNLKLILEINIWD